MDTDIEDQARLWAGIVRGDGLSAAMRAEFARPHVPITSLSQFPTLAPDTATGNAAINLASGLGVVTFRDASGQAWFKGGHNDWTGNMVTRLHPTAGAVAIGARHFLGAFNVFVGPAEHLPIARAIARDVRAASGGLPGVKALGLIVDGQAQVSMNVTDLDAVSLHAVFDAVADAARTRGIAVTHSEIIGLVPQRTIERAFADRIHLRDMRDTLSLEQRIAHTRPADDLTHSANAIAALDRPEASGSAAAMAAILASATVRLAAGVHASRTASPVAAEMHAVTARARILEQQLQHAASDDAAAWHGVVLARRGRSGAPSADAHARAVDDALLVASAVPMRVATLAAEVLSLATGTARAGDDVTAPDAWTGATIAHAATSAALGLLRGNLAMLTNAALAATWLRDAASLQERAAELLATARTAVRHVAG